MIALLALSLAGCRTLEYRQVQRDFQAAVQAENEGVPFTDLHSLVVEQLSPEYIGVLEPKLRPNAWMLRAVSAWRTDQFDLARESARQGLEEPTLVRGSRDDVILCMIPGLVIDSDLRRRWLADRREASAQTYEAYERDFKVALDELGEAQTRFGPNTPEAVQAYLHYQRWRVIQNWANVISRIDPQAPEVMEQAFARAEEFLGASPQMAAQAARDLIPPDHPLRALIRAQGGG